MPDDMSTQNKPAGKTRFQHKIVVLSGKGGVGKSTVAVNLAVSLAASGKRVGLLDVDIHGPTVPAMLGLSKETLESDGSGIIPVRIDNLLVMSIAFLLRHQDDAVIWRGPMKMNLIRQFLNDTEWGDLDYLVVDCPPGTGDEPLSICQTLKNIDGALVVTSPQEIATANVRRSIDFCRRLDIPVLGVVENMSGFICPSCGAVTQVFGSGGGETLANTYAVPFLGTIPLDPAIGTACDAGNPFVSRGPDSSAAKSFAVIVSRLISVLEKGSLSETNVNKPRNESMKIAIPVVNERLNLHFGHCEKFAVMDVSTDTKTAARLEDLTAPPHEPGLLPRWLAEHKVNLIIAGGMGRRAQDLFEEQKIKVIVGAPSKSPEELVKDFLNGTLQAGENACDH